jgi:hypothetical protein
MYENVILHVVHEPDAVIFRKDGSRVPELSLQNRYQPELLNQYLDLVQGPAHWIPCERLLKDVPPFQWHNWLARVISTRLERRCAELEEILKQTNYNWEEAFYRGGRIRIQSEQGTHDDAGGLSPTFTHQKTCGTTRLLRSAAVRSGRNAPC